MLVKAAKGLQCPKEGRHNGFITDKDAVDVPETAYYHRLVTDGSLVIVKDKNVKRDKEAGNGK